MRPRPPSRARFALSRGSIAAAALLGSALLAFAGPAAAAATASCAPAAAPTRARAWRAYVPPGTPIHARAHVGGRLVVTQAGAWRLVLRTAIAHRACLLRVRLAGRPNGAGGWVAASRVRLQPTRWRVEIHRAERRATLLRRGRAVARWRVVVGKPSTPTPAGLFALRESYRTPSSSFEGAWVLTLTAHSDVLQSFAGGDGQVALHGRGGASLSDPLGTAASHGCVRFDNRAIGTIVRRIGRGRLPGVPVRIS